VSAKRWLKIVGDHEHMCHRRTGTQADDWKEYFWASTGLMMPRRYIFYIIEQLEYVCYENVVSKAYRTVVHQRRTHFLCIL
jgi:hypothetical protein